MCWFGINIKKKIYNFFHLDINEEDWSQNTEVNVKQ